MLKFYILAEHKNFIKNLISGVNECTASHLTSQNMVFTLYMIGLSQSITKIKTSGRVLKIFKDYAEHFSILGSSSVVIYRQEIATFHFTLFLHLSGALRSNFN